MFDLTGKGALVTGASGGIGGAIAKALHAQGANVAISGTNAGKLEALASEIGSRVFVLPCDLRDRPAVAQLPKTAEKTLGQMDILVNNAGITHDNLFMRMKDEEWDDVIAVNLTSVFVLTRGILRNMMRRRYGRIVNIASISGVLGNPGPGQLCGLESGIGRHDQIAGARGFEPRHHGELHRPGLHPDPHDRRLDAEASRGYCRRDPRPDLRQARRYRRGRGLPGQRRGAYVTGETMHVNGGMVMV